MARRLRVKLAGLSAGVGALATAAAIATGSSAPAHADLEDLLDPIFQPILTSLSDSVALVDPAAALDLTSWTDTFLDGLNSTFDFALPTTTDTALAAASTAPDAVVAAAPTSIPLEVLIGTEPVVYASLDGGDSVPLLLDTGSSGLVVPLSQFGDDFYEQLQSLSTFGALTGIGSSGYSGGVNYLYLTYDSVPVDYTDLTGANTILETDGAVNIEVFSYNPGDFLSLFTNDAFEKFLDGNQVDGILGIGYNASGPTISPFIDYDGVLVDIPNGQLLLGDYDTTGWVSTGGAPISTVSETVNGVTRAVTVNLDSGGVFGTIPTSLAPSGSDLGEQIPNGVLISVTNAQGQELYNYTTGQFDISDDGTPQLVPDGPYVVSGTYINSGVIPFLNHQVYLDYSGAQGTTYFSPQIP